MRTPHTAEPVGFSKQQTRRSARSVAPIRAGCTLGLAASWAAFTGCGDSQSSTDWQTVRSELPNGATHVVHTAGASSAPTWVLVEEMRVGTTEGAGPEAFTEPVGLVVFDDGGFAVLDRQSQELRVFGPDGSHIATHGGIGQGPGEFVEANGLMLGPNGELWVPDPRNGRMSVFDPEAGFIESFLFQPYGWEWIWSGRMVDESHIYAPVFQPYDQFHIYDLTMTLVDSLAMVDPDFQDEEYNPSESERVFYVDTGNGGSMLLGIPFFPYGAFYLDSRGSIWEGGVDSPGYHLVRRQRSGDTTLVLETHRDPVPVPDDERDSAINSLRERAGVELDWSRIPNVKPAVESVFESVEGNLWVRIPAADGGVLFDVYSAEGDYAGTASLGSEVATVYADPVVRGDRVWMIVQGDLDVSYVVRGRLAPWSESNG